MHPFALSSALSCALAACVTAQEMPQAKRVKGAACADADPDVVNIAWDEVLVTHLKHLARLPGLRRLRINPSGEDTASWRALGVDDLAPIVALPALEELTLPYCCRLSPQHLRKLAACKRLSAVMLINEAITLDEACGKELAAWPALRKLDLNLIRVSVPGLVALAAAPQLEELVLEHCRDLAADEFAAITRLPRLRRLALSGPGQVDLIAGLRGEATDPTWALDLAAARRIGAMTTLRELSLTSCTLPVPHMLVELPQALVSLELCSADVDAAVLQDLRRLGGLRKLVLGDAYSTDKGALRAATANALGSLRLDAFEWQGELDDALRDALRNQPDLLTLGIRSEEDISFVVGLPKLRRLELSTRMVQVAGDRVIAVPSVESFAPLKQSRSLVEVHYHGGLRADVAADLQAALGPKIVLRYLH